VSLLGLNWWSVQKMHWCATIANWMRCKTHTNWLIHIIENDDKTHNARPKKRNPSSDGGFKKMQWCITITNQTQYKACTNQPMPTIENTNEKQCKESPQTKWNIHEIWKLDYGMHLKHVFYLVHYSLHLILHTPSSHHTIWRFVNISYLCHCCPLCFCHNL
jgi:hypothetical protein